MLDPDDRALWDDPRVVHLSNEVARHAVDHATAELHSAIADRDLQLAAQRRLIRWLSLTYGENLPIFHGPARAELTQTYLDALAEDDGDPAFFVAAQTATARPEPAPPVDWGDVAVELVELDDRGNTAR